jgi:hypothetical protein
LAGTQLFYSRIVLDFRIFYINKCAVTSKKEAFFELGFRGLSVDELNNEKKPAQKEAKCFVHAIDT